MNARDQDAGRMRDPAAVVSSAPAGNGLLIRNANERARQSAASLLISLGRAEDRRAALIEGVKSVDRDIAELRSTLVRTLGLVAMEASSAIERARRA